MAAELQMITFALALDALGILTFRRYLNQLSHSARNQIMAWTLLIAAGLAEVIWLVALKNSNGFANTWAGVVSIAVSWISFFLLAYALKFIPAGAA
jgi:Small Multidrug Resistance protein